MTDFYHLPVLRNEVLDALRIEAGKNYIDATTGGGGHSVEIVKRGGILLGIDADAEAVASALLRIREEVPDRREGIDWQIVQGNFAQVREIARERELSQVDGILLDLGVSSHQLDTPDRGFSYRYPQAKLDLRLDQTQGISATTYLRQANKETLYEIFTKFGEEERAWAIAHALVSARSVTGIETVGDVIKAVVEVTGEMGKEATLSRVFQALRIAVNDELESLKKVILGAHELLTPGGRIAIISFHSLEDRIVKQAFRASQWRQVNKKPIIATREEQRQNRRSRSAKLRVAEKI